MGRLRIRETESPREERQDGRSSLEMLPLTLRLYLFAGVKSKLLSLGVPRPAVPCLFPSSYSHTPLLCMLWSPAVPNN